MYWQHVATCKSGRDEILSVSRHMAHAKTHQMQHAIENTTTLGNETEEGEGPLVYDATAGWDPESSEDRKAAIIALTELRPFLAVATLPPRMFDMPTRTSRVDAESQKFEDAVDFLSTIAEGGGEAFLGGDPLGNRLLEALRGA